MIFRITWTDEIGNPPNQTAHWFCTACTEKEALHRAKHEQLAKKDVKAQEWTHCMAPQHAQIPTVPNLDNHSRQIEPAVMVHEGTPYCARCIEHKFSDVGKRIDRLERAFCELLDDFNRHTEYHG